MDAALDPAVKRQYATTDPLKLRILTHQVYSEREVNLDREAATLLKLDGGEAILDVGCGPGLFPRYLQTQGHRGDLVGCDQSMGMLKEALQSAQEEGLSLGWVNGEANRLPFPDRCFDRIVARHMLYHVPDIPGALKEFARVMRPSGCLLAATNAPRDLPVISELKREVLCQFGFAGPLSGVLSFNTENAEALLRTVFRTVEPTIFSNALVFTAPEPIADYIATAFSMRGVPDEETLQAEMKAWLIEQASARLVEHGGILRDPKDVGFYRCTTAF